MPRRSRPRQAPQPLPDHIRPGVRVLFVGINPGLRSAAVGHHFAGFSNRFWTLLFDAKLVDGPVTCLDDARLPEWGYGITNLVARPTRGVGDLAPADYTAGRRVLLAKIRRFEPEVVALLGVTLARVLLPVAGAAGRFPIGRHEGRLGGARVWVLPNPSGRNANFTYAEMRDAFRGLRRELRRRGALPRCLAVRAGRAVRERTWPR